VPNSREKRPTDPSHVPQENQNFSTADDESKLIPIRPGSCANFLQVKSLDGFSNNQLGRYCFNPETEFSHRGFQNPRLKLASFSKQFLKMIIPQCLSNPPSSFLSFRLFPFSPLNISFN